MDRQATYPEEGAKPLTIEQVAQIVIGRIRTAFAPSDEFDDPETLRKAEWVVNGIGEWGETEVPSVFVLHSQSYVETGEVVGIFATRDKAEAYMVGATPPVTDGKVVEWEVAGAATGAL